uniref:Uncharacterized protein n=1 Tax=Oryza meridionalis TaxID=40149 RepID=A0A0E0F592_9ORYZ
MDGSAAVATKYRRQTNLLHDPKVSLWMSFVLWTSPIWALNAAKVGSAAMKRGLIVGKYYMVYLTFYSLHNMHEVVLMYALRFVLHAYFAVCMVFITFILLL